MRAEESDCEPVSRARAGNWIATRTYDLRPQAGSGGGDSGHTPILPIRSPNKWYPLRSRALIREMVRTRAYLDKLEFSSPQELPADIREVMDWTGDDVPGVYAVLSSPFPDGPYRFLYIGESREPHWRVIDSHQKAPCWESEAGASETIYAAFRAMPASTKSERQEVERALVERHRPPCNSSVERRTVKGGSEFPAH